MTKLVERVSPSLLDDFWPTLSPGIVAALAGHGHGEMDALDVRLMLEAERAHLFVAIVDGRCRGCAVVQFLNYPRFRVAHIIVLAGKRLVDEPELFEQFRRLLKQQDATHVEAFVTPRSGVARIARRYGIATVYEHMRGEL